ncbi:MAG: anti-sigma F factor antagonist [Firmicutes bacterium]|nr:anti-sigma F factor antagonist [Bacillota bacterium]
MKVKLESAHRGSMLIASLSGELDDHEADTVRTILDREMEKSGAKRLVLDLADLTFMDSSGLGVILGRYRKLKAQGGQMAIANVSPTVSKLFEISGIRKIMTVYRKREDAVHALKEEAL